MKNCTKQNVFESYKLISIQHSVQKIKREVLHNENPYAFLVTKIKFVCYFLCLFTIRFSPFIM